MYRYVISALILVAVVHAAPQGSPQPIAARSSADETTPIPIISQSDAAGADGSFNYSYESGNGIKLNNSGFSKKVVLPVEEDGKIVNKEQDVQVQVGSYSYTSPDGTIITLKYIADENGFQPQGDHLPTPPPIPEDIQTSLRKQSSSNDNDNKPAASEPVASTKVGPDSASAEASSPGASASASASVSAPVA